MLQHSGDVLVLDAGLVRVLQLWDGAETPAAPLGGGGGSGRGFSRLGASVWYLALLMMLLPPFSVSLLTLGTLCRAPGFVLIFSNSKRKQLVLCFLLSPRMLLRSGIRDEFCPAQGPEVTEALVGVAPRFLSEEQSQGRDV